ncbi:phospholipase/Carboxylesterase [Methylocella silvestris BL2]|uniref:Phospholipase/Carboxylesterase n=1 Tax=Methylocella silvestris (strain DSM 15510 / CIP 108128 / LMG 27833 / NCIMB 13906 / BL2) TaxID=395965 RepID=B8ENQ9_METSB|nr:phospholipase [Methylocella silvestris]ACK50845.1 phospholipase/Carboxylesterase [Methylocella silvestris BL2]
MAALIDGPRLAAKSRTAKQLVVFLHGYGADGTDLIELARQWQPFMPDAAFVSPHAPDPCVQAPGGRQWFPLTMRDPQERWAGVNKAAPTLQAFLDAELDRHKLDDSKLALVGFSQGTMMALHVGLHRARPPAAILGYSGELVGPEHLREAAAAEALKPGRKRPSILLVHGSEDDVISPEALFLSAEALAGADIPCQWHFSSGLGHGIDGPGLKHGGLFLANSFKIKIDPAIRGRM